MRASEFLRHTSVSVLDQGLNSAANFAVGLLLIRTIPTSEYGVFVLANSALYLALGVENALVTAPMAVRAPKLGDAEKRQHMGQLALAHGFLAVPALLLALAVAGLVQLAGYLDAQTSRMVAVTLFAALPFLVREFLRQTLFVFAAPFAVLAIDGVYAVTLLALLPVLVSVSPSGVLAVLAVAIAGFAACLFGTIPYLKRVGWPQSLGMQGLASTWHLSAWGFLGMLVSWAQHQGFLYLLAALQGSESVGNVAAARLLLTPIALLVAGVGTILRPRCASWLARGEARLVLGRALAVSLLTALLGMAYVLVLWWGRSWIVGSLMQKSLVDLEPLLLLWGTVLLLGVWRENLMLVLQALERFDQLFFLALAGGLAALGCGYVLVPGWGAAGAVAGVALGEAVYLAGICVTLFRSRWRGGLPELL